MSKESVEQPDEILVVEAILGNLDAFDELALRYRAAVMRTAQAIVGREFAEDVAQEALVLKLRFLDEMPLKRIAAFLGAPLSTVKWRVHQGKKLLRAAMSDEL